jgi:hypothetical protein
MRAFNFTLLAVLGYAAVIGATPLGARAPAKALDRRQLYVVLTAASGEVLTRLKIFLQPADPADPVHTGVILLTRLREMNVKRCEANPKASFCWKVCKLNPNLLFCGSSDSTSD